MFHIRRRLTGWLIALHYMYAYFLFLSLMNSVSDPKEDETPTSLLLMASSCFCTIEKLQDVVGSYRTLVIVKKKF